jgi:hypothetical protein
MVEQGNLPGDINLCADQWAILQSTAQVLKPFMFVQKLLEGQNYVTVSFIPVLLRCIR